ncbi:hypothetical protein [Stenotrophomonas sp. 22385]|uniref:hypothetical protein n=1 Tax=Stenotrophomonas sp. 22385 TaxID=3453915 RepID=UPI003F831B26
MSRFVPVRPEHTGPNMFFHDLSSSLLDWQWENKLVHPHSWFKLENRVTPSLLLFVSDRKQAA